MSLYDGSDERRKEPFLLYLVFLERQLLLTPGTSCYALHWGLLWYKDQGGGGDDAEPWGAFSGQG